MAYWWDGDSRERFWVEIRKLEGLGRSLWCPDHQRGTDGSERQNPWYELVGSVREGDIVYHYNEREQRFVGRSRAARDAVADSEERSYSVELTDFAPIAAAIDLAFLRARSSVLLGLRHELQAAYPDQTVYSPFQFRSDGLYGMMSNYFAKLPASVVVTLFGEDGLAEAEIPEAPEAGAPGDSAVEPGAPRPPGGYLAPFSPKADSDYVTTIVGSRRPRTRRHETLINACAEWLDARGYEPMRNAAVDLGLEDPSVLFEGKTVGESWPRAVRQAVGQLYEYRYFKVADPEAELVFLSEREVPREWVSYLERDRSIGVMWPTDDGYHLSRLARRALMG